MTDTAVLDAPVDTSTVAAEPAADSAPPAYTRLVPLPDTTITVGASEPSADPPPDPAAPTSQAARPRDERGRFVSGSAEEVAAGTAATEAPAGEPAFGADGSTQQGADPAAPPAVTLPAGEPWTFKVGDQHLTLAGAQVVPGVGLVVPETAIDVLHRALGRAVKADQQLATLATDKKAFADEMAADREFNTRAMTAWKTMAQKALSGDPKVQQDVFDELVQFAYDLPKIEAEAKAEIARRQLEEFRKGTEPAPHVVQQSAMREAYEIVGASLHAKLTAAKELTDDDRKAITAEVTEEMEGLVQPFDGGWGLDEARATRLMDRAIARQVQFRQALASAEAKAKAAGQNAVRTQSQVAAPPAVQNGSGSAPKAAPSKAKGFKNADEYHKWLSS